VTWHSDNPYVADVDGRGVVTAFQCGSATIYAEATDGSGLSASCKVTVTSSTPTAESIVINEIQSANIDMFVDPSFNYGGWVELYNPTNKAVSLNNLYVSDDATNLTKYNLGRDRGIIPAKGFHVLWLDHSNDQFPAQIDFKLDYDGVDVEVYTITGRMVLKATVGLVDEHVATNLSSLPEGVYVVAATDSTGKTKVMKLKIE